MTRGSPEMLRTRPRMTTVDLAPHCRPAFDAAHVPFDAEYLPSLLKLPAGERTYRGVRFAFAPVDAAERWIAVTDPITVSVSGAASHVVFAHTCAPLPGQVGVPELDLWERAAEEIARYILVFEDGSEQPIAIRRRVEVNEWVPVLTPPALTGLPHAESVPVDWRGPHAGQSTPTWGLPGSSSMQALPGSWMTNLGGIGYGKATDESNWWLFAAAVETPAKPLVAIRVEATSPTAAADGLMLGAVTLFHGTESPFAHRPGRTWLVTGDGAGTGARIDDSVEVDVDLGVARLPRRRSLPIDESEWLAQSFRGYGDGWDVPPAEGVLIDVCGSADATVTIAGREFGLANVAARQVVGVDGLEVRQLPPLRTIRVTIRDGDSPTPARISVYDAFGRYLPPAGHRDEVNLAMMEDYGADVRIGDLQYAYVPGVFEIDLPLGVTYWEIARGPETGVIRQRVEVSEPTSELEFALTRWIDMRAAGWISTDPHVHYVPSPTALLEARAEGLNTVHVLATQSGHSYTNVGDLMYGTMIDAAHETAVYVHQEQRQPLLGHLTLLNPGKPIFPLAHGGASTSPFGTPLKFTLADWADQCHAAGGVVISPHFPFPYGEIVPDVILGKLDAIEIFGLTENPDGPRIRDYYRLLNCGYHLPIAGGTDKMSAGTVVGAVRTYAQLAPGAPFGFDSWADAVRAGRTFQTTGPMLSLTVDDVPLGGTVQLGAGGGTVRVRAAARAPYDVGRLEIVLNGAVVASQGGEVLADGVSAAEVDQLIAVTDSSWIAARCVTPYAMRTAFPTAVGGHTSPITLACGDRRQLDPVDAGTLLALMEGVREWAVTLAVCETAADRDHVVELFDRAHGALSARISALS